jgi:hypothetical protein
MDLEKYALVQRGNRKLKKYILSITLFLFIGASSYCQKIETFDSCKYHSNIFKDTCNFSTNLISTSFQYLETNCLSIGCDEELVIDLLGNNIFDKQTIYRRYKVEDKNTLLSSYDYDYYIPYYIWLGCDETCKLNYFPSTQVWLFFKNKKLVKIVKQSFG